MRWTRWIFLLITCSSAWAAAAQVSGSVAASSDFRFRGVSLSADEPVAQADVDIDFANGAYGGLFATNVRLYDGGANQVQATAYGGFAQRLHDGWSVDAGVGYSGFSAAGDYDYAELHAGLATDGFDGRISFAPNYFGLGLRTWYAELNGAPSLAEHVRFVWHAGLLQIVQGPLAGRHTNADARAGVEVAWQAVRLQLARVANQAATNAYPVSLGNRPHGTWLAQLSYLF
jgi:uncharacterized protein (TIGR02001 family)